MQNFKTGDLLLFNYKPTSWAGWLDEIIYWGTHSLLFTYGCNIKRSYFYSSYLKGNFCLAIW